MKKLTVGMRQDELPVDQLPGSWRRAVNKVANKRDGAISNEDGVDDITPTIGSSGTAAYPTAKKVIGEIKSADERILFFGSTTATDSEIGRIKSDGKYYPILKDATSKIVLDFNENYPISGVSAQKYNGNTIIAWTDYNNNPFLLNIDCLPFDLENDFSVTTTDLAKAQALIKLFPPFVPPTIKKTTSLAYGNSDSGLVVLDGQGSLPVGVYYPVMQYQAADGSYTSFSPVYNAVPIAAYGLGGSIRGMTGGASTDSTSKAIVVRFTDVDTKYKAIRIGYLHAVGGKTFAYYEKTYTITGTTLEATITGTDRTQVTLEEVIVPNIVYSKVKSMAVVQNILHLGGVEYDEEFNFQTYANIIDVKWVRNIGSTYGPASVFLNGSSRDGYANGERVFFDKSFKSGECYALYIRFYLKNGTRTKAFHIPGRVVTSGDRDVMNPDLTSPYDIYNALDNNNPIYKYQVKNTHTVTNSSTMEGHMGYWENEDEEYPLDPSNPANIHPDYATIPGIGVSDRKVRHHVFPDLTFLDDAGTGTTGRMFAEPASGSFVTPINDIASHSFGLKVSINIPSGYEDIIDSWEILYAERSNSNIRVIANDLATDSSGSQFVRFNQFDLMVSKPILTPTHVKPLCRWTSNTGANAENLVEYMSGHSIEHLADSALFSNVSEYAYLGENTTGIYNNSGFADCIIAKISPTVTMGTGVDGIGKDAVLFDLCIYRRNVYRDFQTQTLVSTGFIFKVTASGIQSGLVWGGDVFVSRHSVNTLNTGTVAFSYICESISNINYRNEDAAQSKYFAPKYNNPTPSWFGYDVTWNGINKFNQVEVFYPADDCIDEDVTVYPTRIARSLAEGSESKAVNWRIFKSNSYYDMPKDKGAIWSLLGSDRMLYIHHENSLFLASIKDSITTQDGAEIAALGVTELFDRPPIEIVPVSKGYCGTQSQYAILLCEMGYCFIDRDQGCLYVLPRGSLAPKRISDDGMSLFFTSHSQNTQADVDNPFIGNGYTMAYNSLYKTLIVCKQDSIFSFTISYSFEINEGRGGWVSFHDYRPNYISESRDGLLAYENTLFKVFEHNSTSKKCKYYDGTAKKSSIDIVFNENPEQTKRFDNLNWISTVESSTTRYKKESATHLIAYNDTQCTEEINLAKSSKVWYGKDARNTEDTWNFNNFRDMVKDVTQPFLDARGDLITSNINSAKSWYNKSKFISKFVVFRLIYDNTSQKDFHLSYVGSNLKRSDR